MAFDNHVFFMKIGTDAKSGIVQGGILCYADLKGRSHLSICHNEEQVKQSLLTASWLRKSTRKMLCRQARNGKVVIPLLPALHIGEPSASVIGRVMVQAIGLKEIDGITGNTPKFADCELFILGLSDGSNLEGLFLIDELRDAHLYIFYSKEQWAEISERHVVANIGSRIKDKLDRRVKKSSLPIHSQKQVTSYRGLAARSIRACSRVVNTTSLISTLAHPK